MATIETLRQVFCTVFEDDAIELRPEMTSDDIEGWDSLSHVTLILAVEDAFHIRFSQKELLTFKNVGDLLRSIENKIS